MAAPPRLDGAAQAACEEISKLPGVIVQAHWEIGSQTEVNGTDFYVGEEELGHIHLDGEAHIAVGQELAAVLIRARLARRFHWSREFVVVDTDDVAHAVWVFGLRRAQVDGAEHVALCERVAAQARLTT